MSAVDGSGYDQVLVPSASTLVAVVVQEAPVQYVAALAFSMLSATLATASPAPAAVAPARVPAQLAP